MIVAGSDRRPFNGYHHRLAQRLGQPEQAAQERRQRQARVQQEEQPTAREVRARPAGRRGKWVA